MTKRMCLVGVLLCSLAWVGCNSGSNSESSTTMNPVSKAQAMLTAVQISDAMHKATAWHMNMKSASMEMDMDVVCPDKMQMSSKTQGRPMEMVRVGNDMYTKMGAKWMKIPSSTQQAPVCGGPPSGQEKGAAGRVPTLDTTMKLSKGGTQVVNGETCTEWNGTTTDSAGKTHTWSLCVGSDNLPRMMKNEDMTITYSNWNKPVTIEAPKI